MKFLTKLISTLLVYNVIVEALPLDDILNNHFQGTVQKIDSSRSKGGKAEVANTLKFLTGILNMLKAAEIKNSETEKIIIDEPVKKDGIKSEKIESTKKEVVSDVINKIENAKPMENEIERSHNEELKKDMNVNYIKPVPMKENKQAEYIAPKTPEKVPESTNLKNKQIFQKLFGTLPKLYTDLGSIFEKPTEEDNKSSEISREDETKDSNEDKNTNKRIKIYIRPKRILFEKKELTPLSKKSLFTGSDELKPSSYRFPNGEPMFIPRPKSKQDCPLIMKSHRYPSYSNSMKNQRFRKSFFITERQQEMPKSLFMITRTVPTQTQEKSEGLKGFFENLFKKNEEKQMENPVKKSKYLRLNEILKKLQTNNAPDNTKTIYQKESFIDPSNKSIILKETIISFSTK